MSKLTKLVNQPGLFLQDALSSARARVQLVTLRQKDADQVRRRVGRVDGRTPLADALVLAVGDTADVFFTVNVSGYDELNAFAHDIPWLVYHASLLAEQRQCRLLITAARHTTEVEPRDVAQVCARLMSASHFDVIFHDDGVEESARVTVWERRETEDVCFSRGQNAHAKELPVAMFEAAYDRAAARVDLAGLYRCPTDSECTFDVDFVYTWVNHTDPLWRELILRYRDLGDGELDRYRSADELLYSLRSVHEMAPWVRHIFVVTNCQRPPWLADHPKVRWVSHEEIFPRIGNGAYLPTFNPHAIESCLMRIPELSEHFVYLNDDMFLGMPCSKRDFFAPNGVSISYLEPYGMVVGEVAPNKSDRMNAAINGRKLMEETFGVSSTQLHTHAPHALSRSVLSEMADRFGSQFDSVRRARFRAASDVSMVSFLYHHYAFQQRAAQRAGDASVVSVRAANSARAYVDMLSGERRRFFSIDDGGPDAFDERFHARTAKFLQTYFPNKAPWER